MRVIKVVAIAVLIYLAVVMFYAFMQRSFIYFPQTQSLDAAMASVNRMGGSAWLDDEGNWLGWRHLSPGATGRVLVMHGNAGQALDRRYWTELFRGMQESGPWEVTVLEYPGYGPRTGKPSEPSLRDAALQAMDRLQAERPGPVLLLGESLGSGVAAHVAAARRDTVAGIVLVTPFASLGAVAKHHMPFLPVSLLLRDRFDTLELLAGFDGPMVIVTGTEDTIVPEQLALPLKAAHRGPLLHWSQPGAGHNDIDVNPRAHGWREIDTFLATQLSRPGAQPDSQRDGQQRDKEAGTAGMDE
jgi:pimeloyl-ACP methyl ester carboxylesterase